MQGPNHEKRRVPIDAHCRWPTHRHCDNDDIHGTRRVGEDMTHVQFLRIKKLTGKAIIEVAARHNHREILAELGAGSAEHINPARVRFNRVLRIPANVTARSGERDRCA